MEKADKAEAGTTGSLPGGVSGAASFAGSAAAGALASGPMAGVAAESTAGEHALSSARHVMELADGLSLVADRLHERIVRDIRREDGQAVPEAVQAAMRTLLDDEMVLRQRANALYANAATFIIAGLGQPQGRLVALTADAAEKIRRIGVIGEVTSLVGGLLALAGAVAAGKPAPIVRALDNIQTHAAALDALMP